MNFNKNIVRKTDDAKLAGVCNALAEMFDWDVQVVRTVYIVLTAVTAFFPGIFLYLFLMLLIPKDENGLTSENVDE